MDYEYLESKIKEYDELETELIKMTGWTFQKIVDLIAAGYTLQAPKNKPLNELIWAILK